MSNALKNVKKNSGTQMERDSFRTDEVKNNAGGFVFKVSDKDRLERFLILGTDGGTYYVGEKTLTKQNVDFLVKMIEKDEALVLSTLLDVARNNRAAKNNGSLFTLAALMVFGKNKAATKVAVPEVARTATHLYDYAQYIENLGGWGRAKRESVANWFTSKDAGTLAYQAVKYRQRNGWTLRDLMRLSHPQGVDKNVGNFILGKGGDSDIAILNGFKAAQSAKTEKDVLAVLDEYQNLPWETIPTEFLKSADVWKKIFYSGALGQTALLRNVTRFARIGAFDDVKFAGDVAKALADADRIAKGRVHPVAYANALGIYRDGQMDNGGWYGTSRSKNWKTNAKVLGALEAGFYESFSTVRPAGKRTLISIDTSASMTWGAPAGLVGMDYMGAAALMAMVTLRTEPYTEITGFSTDLRKLDISDTDSLETVDQKIRRAGGGGTDCAQPMLWAAKNKRDFDTFAVLTDNETWAGRVKPHKALTDYRAQQGIDARLAVVALAGTEFTIADPTDRGMMDFVGMDSNGPRVLADFSAGRI